MAVLAPWFERQVDRLREYRYASATPQFTKRPVAQRAAGLVWSWLPIDPPRRSPENRAFPRHPPPTAVQGRAAGVLDDRRLPAHHHAERPPTSAGCTDHPVHRGRRY